MSVSRGRCNPAPDLPPKKGGVSWLVWVGIGGGLAAMLAFALVAVIMLARQEGASRTLNTPRPDATPGSQAPTAMPLPGLRQTPVTLLGLARSVLYFPLLSAKPRRSADSQDVIATANLRIPAS